MALGVRGSHCPPQLPAELMSRALGRCREGAGCWTGAVAQADSGQGLGLSIAAPTPAATQLSVCLSDAHVHMHSH